LSRVERHGNGLGQRAGVVAFLAAGYFRLRQVGVFGDSVGEKHHVAHGHSLAERDSARISDSADHGDIGRGQEGGPREDSHLILVLKCQIVGDSPGGIGER
jgi:hypothetical protein